MPRWRIDLRDRDELQLSLGLMLPLAAGLALFGWRTVGVVAAIAFGALVGRFLLARLTTWTATPRVVSMLAQSGVIALFCPATLFDPELSTVQPTARWPLLLAAGLLLALFDWASRRLGRRCWHGAAVVAAVLTLGTPWLTQTDRVLRPRAMIVGDIFDERTAARPAGSAEPWMELAGPAPEKVLITPPAGPRLQSFLHGRTADGRTGDGRPGPTVARLLSDDLPPLEDLVVGGHPSPVGRGSLIALLVGGLMLVYRGFTPLRVPVLALIAAYVTIAVLPLPTGVGGGRRWLLASDPRVGWAAGLTLVHYLLAASAVPAVATFLLTQPTVRPRRWAGLFAIVFGIAAGAATVFLSVSGGALAALLVVQGLWPRKIRR